MTDKLLSAKAEMDRLAAIINAPPSLLPSNGDWSEGFHVEYRDGAYNFVNVERDKEIGRAIVSSLDELLYQVFREITWTMAYDYARQFLNTEADIRRIYFPKQVELLGRLSPRWVLQRRKEQEDILRKTPESERWDKPGG